jgi:uncharacterized protein (TIGR01319 family)
MRIYLLVDFGSTYTKISAVDLDQEVVIGSAQSPTTVESDITMGLDNALAELYKNHDIRPDEICGKLACSSAAGGLKIAAVGLVPDLTLKAAKMAALGAGAKVLCAYGYEIDSEITRNIEDKCCDIVLLCGGTDGGNKDVILHNAKELAHSRINCPILVCGNRVTTARVCEILRLAGKQVYTAKNVLPEIDRVEAQSAQEQIREIFISHIIEAKGLDKASSLFQKDIIPTPMASLKAAELLADGTGRESGIGSLLVVEVGGATTNIHSVVNITPVTSQTVVRGLPEARISRTVEGDMGIRYKARTIYDIVGGEHLNKLALSLESAPTGATFESDAYMRLIGECVGYVPQSDAEALLDIALAKSAVDIAVGRHAGHMKTEFSAIGEVTVQYGKNLLDVKNIVGTGGIFKYGKQPEAVLASALLSPQAPMSLRPKVPRAFVDREYIFYAMGLLAQEFPDVALRIAKKYIAPVSVVI